MDFALLVPPGLDTLTVAILLGISFVGSFITVSFGMGGGQLMIASLAQVLPPIALIPIHGAVQLGSNVGRTLILWNGIVWASIPLFLIGTVIGASMGAALFVQIQPWIIQLCVGTFILWTAVGKLPPITGKHTFATGVFASFLTMFFGSTAHFIAAIVKAMNLDPLPHVATHSTMMTLQHGVKIIAFGILGFAFGPYLPFLAAMIAVGLIGTALGKRVLVKAGHKYFKPVLTGILVVLGLRMLYIGLQGAADQYGLFSA